MKTYAQASKVKEGWRHADDESMCVVVADSIAMYNALKPVVVYDWIRKHYGTDWKSVFKMRSGFVPYHDLVGPILSDKPAIAK